MLLMGRVKNLCKGTEKMTVEELIQQLKYYPPKYQVRIYNHDKRIQYRLTKITWPKGMPRTIYLHIPEDK